MKCLSGARQAYLSVQMYCNDYKDYYPAGDGSAANPLWHVKLTTLGYMKEATQTSRGGCPDGPDKFFTFYEGGDYYTHVNITDENHSWAGFPAPARASYGLNGLLQSGWARTDPYNVAPFNKFWGTYRRTAPSIRKHAADVGLIFCVAAPWSNGTQHLYPMVKNVVGEDPTPYFAIWGDKVAGRHNRVGLPVVYCDGHGETVPPNGITTIFDATPSKPLMWFSETWLKDHPPFARAIPGDYGL
jgi:hypothetical protein